MSNLGKIFGLALCWTLVPCFNAESSSYPIGVWNDSLLEENPDQIQKEEIIKKREIRKKKEIRKKRKLSFDTALLSPKHQISHFSANLSKQVLSSLQGLDPPLSVDLLKDALFKVLSKNTLHKDSLDSLEKLCALCATNITDKLSEKTRRKGFPLQEVSSTQMPGSPTKKKLRQTSSGSLGVKSKDLYRTINESITDLLQQNLIAPLDAGDLPQPYTMDMNSVEDLNLMSD